MILPGSSIGILGGGQLGRMFGIAARRMGYRVHCLDPAQDCPAGQVADVEINRPYDDIDAARNFANRVDVVTFEFENVPAETLEAIEAITPVHPSPHVLHTCRHRLREKTFLREHGFPHADWRECQSAEDVAAAVEAFGGGILKTALFGYDGKGQSKLKVGDDYAAAWAALNQPTCVVEKIVPFDREISVIVARTANGEMKSFPPFENVHVNHILDVTTCPANAPGAVELAEAITEKLDVVGLLAVEMFVVGNDILVNELAPRPHNSGHLTFDACVTSQFEQQLRAVCGLPLGDPSLLCGGAAMANLLGDLWENGEPSWPAALQDPRVKLHLYGKTEARKGRKMGHLVACGISAVEVAAHVRRSCAALAK
ncbi:MAG: 5-(carboxyamino)imidazole ribonucleotide synthase [Planctomycetota bacterium]